MTRSLTGQNRRRDAVLLDEEAWDAPRRLTDDELFAHGGDGWRRTRFDFDDPEEVR